MQLSDVTWQTVLLVIGALLVMVGVYSSVMAAIKTARDERARREQPMNDLSRRVDGIDNTIGQMRVQLDTITRKEEANDDCTKLMLRGMVALMRHGVDGNNIEGLKDMQGEIQEYLINR